MSILGRMLNRDDDKSKSSDKPDDATPKHDAPSDEPGTSVAPIDQIAGQSLLSTVEKGAFHGLTDEQRQSATFRTGTVLGASMFELGKAFDDDIPEGESYRRGATGLIGLFEVAYSAKKVLTGLQFHDRVAHNKRHNDSRKRRKNDPDLTNIGFEGIDGDEKE